MKKTCIILVVLLVVVAAMVACSVTALADTQSNADTIKTKIAHISDIHVMIEEYCNIYSPDYLAAGHTSYKVLEQTEAAVEAVFAEMMYKMDANGNLVYDTTGSVDAKYKDANGALYKDAKDIPQYVFITGDLTSNGELADHIGVARLLTTATEDVRRVPGMSGFQIFVIPGNHDIDNQHAKAYNPDPEDAEWAALVAEAADYAKSDNVDDNVLADYRQRMQAYLSALGSRSVPTTTMLNFMSIYSDFGYCNCKDKAKGIHDHAAGCKIADGVCLDFFYESDYWYEGGVTRSERPESLGDDSVFLTKNYCADAETYGDYVYDKEYKVYTNGVESDALSEDLSVPDAVQDAYKVDKDMEYYASYSRHGACSYIARVNGVTIVGLDANSHKFTDLDENANIAQQTSRGWHETTGGYVTKAQLCWVIDNLRRGNDAAKHNLVVALAHENVLPHFDTEDEVISLFTYDNWEDVYTNLTDNGVRYVFTGHQHTNDIESEVSQAGGIFFDVETGSTTCMGAGWREMDFEQVVYADHSYSEDVYSTMHFLHDNVTVKENGQDRRAFLYQRYQVTDEAAYTKVTVIQRDAEGNIQDLADFMSLNLKGMITNIAGNFVNDNLIDKLKGMSGGLEGFSTDVAALVGTLLDQLDKFDLYEFIPGEDNTSFELGPIKKGENLTKYAKKLVNYFLGHDYSFGKVKGGLHLDDVLLYVYGNHLIGAQDYDTVPADIDALLQVLENGTFLRYFEDLMLRGVMPQLELILNAPIYWGLEAGVEYRALEDSSYVTAEMVADGKGFDLSDYAYVLRGKGKAQGMGAMIMKLLPAFIKPADYGDKGSTPGLDVSSVMHLIRSLPDAYSQILNDLKKALSLDVIALAEAALKRSVDSYIDKGIGYIRKLDSASLTQVVKDELLDKYVTDAFCKNLGSYGAYVVRSVILDDSRDGATRTDEDSLFPYQVTSRFHLELTYADADALQAATQGHTYFCDKDGNDTVKVKATTQNGLLPGMITLGNVIDDNGDLDTTKKEVHWFTQRDVDYMHVCKQFEQDDAEAARDALTFQCELAYGTDAKLADATTKTYTGKNVWIEYPTIDLGIIYLNMTYAYRQYNEFDVVLTDLKPATTYYYRLRSAGGDYDWTPIYSFTTPAATGGWEIMAMTDIQGSIEQNYIASHPNMTQAVSQGNPDFIISAGDNVDKGENISQWSWLLDGQADVWANYAFAGVVGNHEKHSYSLSSVTATPTVATKAETGFYYSFDYQNVHFVMLNTNDIQTYAPEGKASYQALGQEQYDWLVADLSAAQKDTSTDFIVVTMHKGPYTAGSHAFDDDVIGLRAQLTPVFATYGVDIVLQGHDHTYSVSEYIGGTYDDAAGCYGKVDVKYDATGAVIDPDGVLYINLGTMGDKYYNYIYSSQVTLRDRSQDAYLRTAFARYFTDKGAFELSPVRDSKTVYDETPVFAYLSVSGKRLSFVSYTVINGVSYAVDDIVLTKAPTGSNVRKMTLLGKTYDKEDLDTLTVVTLPVVDEGVVTYYTGYYLADLYAVKGITDRQVAVDGQDYAVAGAFVAVYSSDNALATGDRIAPLLIVSGGVGQATVIVATTGGKALPGWATTLIVIAAVIVSLGAVLWVLLSKRNNKPKTGAADAAAPKDEATQEDAQAQSTEGDDASDATASEDETQSTEGGDTSDDNA